MFQDALGYRSVIGGAGDLGPKDLKTLTDACGDYALPIQQRRRDGLVLEHRISELVNQAYGAVISKGKWVTPCGWGACDRSYKCHLPFHRHSYLCQPWLLPLKAL